MPALWTLLTEHFADPFQRGVCETATHAALLAATATGCELQIELSIRESIIREAWFLGAGCECCEGLASLICEQLEGREAARLQSDTVQSLVTAICAEDWETLPTCKELPWQTLQSALTTPLELVDGEQRDFSGPSLREEC